MDADMDMDKGTGMNTDTDTGNSILISTKTTYLLHNKDKKNTSLTKKNLFKNLLERWIVPLNLSYSTAKLNAGAGTFRSQEQ
jgi:hypothetical protein